MPYLMGGFPDLETSRRIGLAYAEAGADLVELGVPFSDPLADGPVIHAAGTAALRAGAKLDGVLDVGRSIAEQVPVVVMCYANPIFARGVERFVDALARRVDQRADRPRPAARGVRRAARDLRPRAGSRSCRWSRRPRPTSGSQRIGASARGFLYTVSVTGTTGERAGLDGGLAGVIARAAAHTKVPVAVGFGIGEPAQAAAAAAAGADGVIVGSRLVRAAGEAADPVGGRAARSCASSRAPWRAGTELASPRRWV